MTDSNDAVDKLYKNYELLSSNPTEHQKEFQEILNAVTGSEKEKKLAAQFISKFYKHFPDLVETAIDRQLDLCEDEDVQIRRLAIKELPTFCKDSKENTPKISDILSQLLITREPTELTQVNISLQTLSKYDALGTATGIFSQITQGDEQTRLKCLQYLANRFIKFGPDVFSKEVEEFVIIETKKILQDVASDEFRLCMAILSHTKLGKTITGHTELVALCLEQADLNADLDTDAAEDEIVDIYIQCATEAIPYYSSQIESTPFVKFMCEKFLPLTTWNLIAAADEQAQTHLRLLKVLAELCTFCGTIEKKNEAVDAVYKVLLEYMPLPPADAELSENPSFQFSHAECLLYALHKLGKQCPEFLTFPTDPAKLKDFRSRLQYLARGTQGYIKKLQEAVKGKSPEEMKNEENQIAATALKTTSNISSLIRDLFHSPPSYKTVIQLSWVQPKTRTKIQAVTSAKPAVAETTAVPSVGSKRHAPITFENGSKTETTKGPKQAKTSNGNGQVYSPPSGKYSGKVSTYGQKGNGNGNGNGNGTGRNNRYNNNRFRSGRNNNKSFKRY